MSPESPLQRDIVFLRSWVIMEKNAPILEVRHDDSYDGEI
jgi:hypothetical protein